MTHGVARFASPQKLLVGANVGAAINVAMKALEKKNKVLRGVLLQILIVIKRAIRFTVSVLRSSAKAAKS